MRAGRLLLGALALALAVPAGALAQPAATLRGPELLAALRAGGCAT